MIKVAVLHVNSGVMEVLSVTCFSINVTRLNVRNTDKFMCYELICWLLMNMMRTGLNLALVHHPV